MTIEYPRSRVKHSGQCHECNREPGRMQAAGRLQFRDAAGGPGELMVWSCNRCGHTVLFNLDVARTRPFDGQGVQEELPK